jgi:hypothetical protein
LGWFYSGRWLFAKKDNSDVLSIGLAIKDKSHVELFKRDIEATHPIYEGLVRNSKRSYKSKPLKDSFKVEIKLLSKFLPEDLKRFNIVPRKSLIYTFPEWLINHPLLNHFMRGYVDGDGSWYIGSSKKTDQLCFNLLGTPSFITIFRSILEDKCDLPERNKPIRIRGKIGVLEYGGNGVICKIRDFLYKDAVTFLQRKFDKVKDVVVVERLSVTPEFLIQRMSELGEQKKIAEELGCSRPNISRYVAQFSIEEQMEEAKRKFNGHNITITQELLISKMRELGSQVSVAKALGESNRVISRYVRNFGIQEKMKEAKRLYLQAA